MCAIKLNDKKMEGTVSVSREYEQRNIRNCQFRQDKILGQV
jgi:hypothetical protein